MPSPYIDFTSHTARLTVSDSQELKWLAYVAYAMRGIDCPWYELLGGLKSMKPIKEIADFSTIRGQEIIQTVDRPWGLPGVQGASRLRGSGYEEKEVHATYRAKVGILRKAAATDSISKTETLIGSTFDVRERKKTAEWFKWQMADEIVYELIKRAHSRNTVFPNGKTAISQLNSADYLDLGTVEQTQQTLSINQAGAFDLRRDTRTGQAIPGYMVMGSHYGFTDLKRSNHFQNLMVAGRERGDKNELFNGGLPMWDYTKMHSYILQDTTADGPIGGPGVARGRLGIAITADDEVQDIVFGGNARKAALTLPLFAQHFSNAQFVGHEGEKIAADTTTERYVAIHNVTTDGKIGFYAFKVNNGNKLVMTKRLRAAGDVTGDNISYTTIGQIVWDSVTFPAAGDGANFRGLTDEHPVGAMIYEVNEKGQPFVRSWGIGENMMLAGFGAIEKAGVAKHGMRIIDTDDYDFVNGAGYAQVWGCRANEDADNMPNGFVMIVSAWNPPGWPTIAL